MCSSGDVLTDDMSRLSMDYSRRESMLTLRCCCPELAPVTLMLRRRMPRDERHEQRKRRQR